MIFRLIEERRGICMLYLILGITSPYSNLARRGCLLAILHSVITMSFSYLTVRGAFEVPLEVESKTERMDRSVEGIGT